MPQRHGEHRDRRREGIGRKNLRLFLRLLSVIPVSLWPTSRCGAEEPTTKPTDATIDWILSQPTTAPSTSLPTTAHVSPLIDRQRADSRLGRITLSDGTLLRGEISTTADKPLRIYDADDKQYNDVPMRDVASISAN